MTKFQVVCGIVLKSMNLYRADFFHQSDEYDVFLQFWSFKGKVYFITWMWKLWKLMIKEIFLNHISQLQGTNLLTPIYPTNMQIKCKFVVDFHCFVLIVSEI